MDSHHIDAQFDRAVEIVQSLPKIGPIQTTYDEKLTMYRCIILPCSLLVVPTHDSRTVCTSKVHMFVPDERNIG
jgi:hypothetical protein